MAFTGVHSVLSAAVSAGPLPGCVTVTLCLSGVLSSWCLLTARAVPPEDAVLITRHWQLGACSSSGELKTEGFFLVFFF